MNVAIAPYTTFRDHGPATIRRGDVFGLLPTQFAVPTNSAGEEQLRRAGLDPQLLQQMADPASAL